MKKTLLTALSLLAMIACSAKYVSSGVVAPSFDASRTYKVAIMPLAVRGLLTPTSFARDKAYDHLLRELMDTGKLMPIDKYTVEQQVRLNEFGAEGKIDPVMARKVGKEVGADLVVIAECAFEEETPKVILNTTVEVLDLGTAAQIYSGRARTMNPASTLAAAELGLELASQKLVNAMK